MGHLENITMYAAPEGWGVVFGKWNEAPIWLTGFETSFDAWGFVFAHFGIDISIPGMDRQWTNKPRKAKPKQIRMSL